MVTAREIHEPLFATGWAGSKAVVMTAARSSVARSLCRMTCRKFTWEGALIGSAAWALNRPSVLIRDVIKLEREEDGRYYNCNFHKNEYKRLGIGVISHRDQSKREILLNDVLRYLTKKDELVKLRTPRKTKMFGTSLQPKKHSGRGHKRAP